MVRVDEIEKTLRRLNELFQKEENSDLDNCLFSKLALLEFCGWIEFALDDVIKEFSSKASLSSKNQKYVDEQIKRNSGFSYDKHYKPLLIKLIGIINYQKLEVAIDGLVSTLNYLYKARNDAAHTHTTHTELETRGAPSHIISYLPTIRNLFRTNRRFLKFAY